MNPAVVSNILILVGLTLLVRFTPESGVCAGQVDAMACLQVSEDGGVVIEWVCANPGTLGIPSNAVDWLIRGISAICGKRLDLPVTVARRARGEAGTEVEPEDLNTGRKGKRRRAAKQQIT